MFKLDDLLELNIFEKYATSRTWETHDFYLFTELSSDKYEDLGLMAYEVKETEGTLWKVELFPYDNIVFNSISDIKELHSIIKRSDSGIKSK